MSLLESLPQELYIDNIFTFLTLRDALSLFQVNRFFAKLGNDEVFWKRRLREDFNFTNASNARSSGFKFLYSRLNKPRVFAWGESGQGRLGREIPRNNRSWVMDSKQFWPLEVPIRGARIVELAAGGWSFTAIDANGGVHVWGQLESGYGLVRDGFAHNSKQATKPLLLNLPKPIQTISCGRNFATALDRDGQIWCFNSWGRPFVYKPKAFDGPWNRMIQIESGWSFSAALTASGNVYVWNPLVGEVGDAFENKDTELDHLQMGSLREEAAGAEVDGVIQCYTWSMEGVEPLVLPELPSLPNLKGGEGAGPRLVKIAAGDQFIVGLTDGGHVVKLDLSDINNPNAIKELALLYKQRLRGWEYLPKFCDRSQIKELDEFKKQGGPLLPDELEINHISAHFLTFVAYSTGEHSIVLMGSNDAAASSNPRVIPALQNRGVISVVLGDYHFGALLASGKLLTYGAAGSTGLGNPYKIQPGQPGGFRTLEDRERNPGVASIPDIREPTEVKFDHGLKKSRERFVFAAAAAGWHMGAIVVDLEANESEELESAEEDSPEPTAPTPGPFAARRGLYPPVIRGGTFPLRVGLAGANIAHRGHHQQHQPPQDDT